MSRHNSSEPRSVQRGVVAAAVFVCSGCVLDAEPTPLSEQPWTPLVESSWTLEPGTEKWQCERRVVTDDLFVAAIGAHAPLGMHHALLSYGEREAPDGTAECDPREGQHFGIATYGVGSPDVVLPDGYAIRIPGGQQLLLNLHLFNVSDQTLSNTSGIYVKSVPETEVVQEAQAILLGSATGRVVPARSVTEHVVRCEATEPATLVAMFVHMHQLGTHMKVSATQRGIATVVHDEPFSFDLQDIRVIEPIEMTRGDIVDIHCTYENPTDFPVEFGQSSTDEMCFVGFYRSPPTFGEGFECSQ